MQEKKKNKKHKVIKVVIQTMKIVAFIKNLMTIAKSLFSYLQSLI